MSNKIASIISYITIIGWLIAYFGTQNQSRNELLKLHLKQSLGLAILGILSGIAINVISSIVPFLSFLSFLNLAFLAFMVIGILNANSEKMEKLPVIGNLFEGKFDFIK